METISDADLKELENWRDESEANRQTFSSLVDNKTVANYLEIESRIEAVISKEHRPPKTSAITFLRRYVIPAAAMLLLFLGIYLWRILSSQDKTELAKTETIPPIQDIAPGKFKAKLRLADGKEIILDDTKTGLVAKQDRIDIVNRGNAIEYSPSSGSNGQEVYNTLMTSTGETYPLTLSDGSKVWLNALSSIKFPVAFRGKDRKVEITGEVYFEVQKNGKPFHVIVLNQEKPVEVQVLGTHFNVNAYDDEHTVNTTLLEGSVAVRALKTNETQFIKPGQQARVDQQGTSKIEKIEMDGLNAIVAWKNQNFYFESEDLKSIMRKLSRWYGVNVSYQGDIPDRQFSGMLSRSRNLTEVLNMLERSKIHFTIEGKNLLVKP